MLLPLERSRISSLLQRQEQLIAVLRAPAMWAVAVEVWLKAIKTKTQTLLPALCRRQAAHTATNISHCCRTSHMQHCANRAHLITAPCQPASRPHTASAMLLDTCQAPNIGCDLVQFAKLRPARASASRAAIQHVVKRKLNSCCHCQHWCSPSLHKLTPVVY